MVHCNSRLSPNPRVADRGLQRIAAIEPSVRILHAASIADIGRIRLQKLPQHHRLRSGPRPFGNQSAFQFGQHGDHVQHGAVYGRLCV